MLTYEKSFWSHRHCVLGHARIYIQGLLKPDLRKNVENIAEDVPNGNVQNLQQFISSSKWDAREVMNQTALNADELLGHTTDACLLIDESGFPKKGKASVGVSRQWLGCVGKTDNGQVGVFSALCNGKRSQLVNTRLYLPDTWTNDEERCDRVGIPETERRFRTKEKLALEMVDEALEQNLRFGWVGADAGYGKGLGFMLDLEKKDLTFAVDVHSTQKIFLKRPHPDIPSKANIRGRMPTRHIVNEKSYRVDKWVASIADSQWEKIKVRDSTKGDLMYDVTCKRVYLWDKGMGTEVKRWWLVVRRNYESKKDYKYTFINANSKTPKNRLAYMQAQRYWVEHAFEVCKSDCGMGDYEVRSWDGWHHHMALSMMAQFFLLTEAVRNKKEHPLLSPRDVMILLTTFLPRKEPTVEDIIHEMESRHRQREKTRLSAINKQQN